LIRDDANKYKRYETRGEDEIRYKMHDISEVWIGFIANITKATYR